MSANASITRRLTLSIFVLEFVAALVLIATLTAHEHRVRFETFDANLHAAANALLGAVQESDTKDGSVMLDRKGLALPSRAVFQVTADHSEDLGRQGLVPSSATAPGSMFRSHVDGQQYRFYVLEGVRIIDPGRPAEIVHQVRVIYGLPESHTWHEVWQATRFYSLATLLFLGLTALILFWLIQRFLSPIRELAQEAEKVDAERWSFRAPASSTRLIELRPLGSAIEKTVARLQRSFDQQRRFTSDAAHELKTDLAIIKSSVQLLAMRHRTAAEYEGGLQLTLKDIERLELTVNKMLTLARLEQSTRPERQGSDLAEVLKDAVTQTEVYASSAQVRLRLMGEACSAPVPVTREDALLLCSNVLMNAVQHSLAHGVVELQLRCEAEKVRFSVRDHGEGIQESDRPHLFEAFYRSDASRNRKRGGTGLGLAICKAICDRAGGSISIANHPAGGALVQVELPRSGAAAHAGHDQQPALRISG